MSTSTLHHHHDTPYVPPTPEATPAADASPPTGRQPNGRFARGHAGGPGNPFARQTAALRSALVHAVTPDDIRQIAEELLLQAKAGNLAAVKLLFSYVLGKPAEAVSPDSVELDEWRLRQQAPTAAEVQEAVCERRSPALVNTVTRAVTLVQQQELLDLIGSPQPGHGEAQGQTSGNETAVHGSRTDPHEESRDFHAGRADPAGEATVNNRCFSRPNEGLAALLRIFDAPRRVPADQFPLPEQQRSPAVDPGGSRDRSRRDEG